MNVKHPNCRSESVTEGGMVASERELPRRGGGDLKSIEELANAWRLRHRRTSREGKQESWINSFLNRLHRESAIYALGRKPRPGDCQGRPHTYTARPRPPHRAVRTLRLFVFEKTGPFFLPEELIEALERAGKVKFLK